ncbi:kinase-like domain-containing protein [Pelagophyceae sp. CCMP2097]|nr:kinase-like domain-containing protein [Pelagophyceae sp. CCMP2097]
MPEGAFGPGACASIDCYEKGARIGEGTYGVIYRAVDRRGGGAVALKRLLPHNEAADGFPLTSLRELDALRRLRGHAHVVRLLDVAVGAARGAVFLVLEFCEVGDLSGILDRHRGAAFCEADTKTLARQLLGALRHCHAGDVVHRDVKVANLLYTQRGALKLCDFGLARVVRPGEARRLTRDVATLWYRAPELLFGADDYGAPVDLWAAGCVLAEVFRNGRPLVDGADESDQLRRIFRAIGAPSEAIWPGLERLPRFNSVPLPPAADALAFFSRLNVEVPHAGAAGLDFLAQLLCYDPAARATARGALADRGWFDAHPPPTPAHPTQRGTMSANPFRRNRPPPP